MVPQLAYVLAESLFDSHGDTGEYFARGVANYVLQELLPFLERSAEYGTVLIDNMKGPLCSAFCKWKLMHGSSPNNLQSVYSKKTANDSFFMWLLGKHQIKFKDKNALIECFKETCKIISRGSVNYADVDVHFIILVTQGSRMISKRAQKNAEKEKRSIENCGNIVEDKDLYKIYETSMSMLGEANKFLEDHLNERSLCNATVLDRRGNILKVQTDIISILVIRNASLLTMRENPTNSFNALDIVRVAIEASNLFDKAYEKSKNYWVYPMLAKIRIWLNVINILRHQSNFVSNGYAGIILTAKQFMDFVHGNETNLPAARLFEELRKINIIELCSDALYDARRNLKFTPNPLHIAKGADAGLVIQTNRSTVEQSREKLNEASRDLKKCIYPDDDTDNADSITLRKAKLICSGFLKDYRGKQLMRGVYNALYIEVHGYNANSYNAKTLSQFCQVSMAMSAMENTDVMRMELRLMPPITAWYDAEVRINGAILLPALFKVFLHLVARINEENPQDSESVLKAEDKLIDAFKNYRTHNRSMYFVGERMSVPNNPLSQILERDDLMPMSLELEKFENPAHYYHREEKTEKVYCEYGRRCGLRMFEGSMTLSTASTHNRPVRTASTYNPNPTRLGIICPSIYSHRTISCVEWYSRESRFEDGQEVTFFLAIREKGLYAHGIQRRNQKLDHFSISRNSSNGSDGW